jgi:hypothetical protein
MHRRQETLTGRFLYYEKNTLCIIKIKIFIFLL